MAEHRKLNDIEKEEAFRMWCQGRPGTPIWTLAGIARHFGVHHISIARLQQTNKWKERFLEIEKSVNTEEEVKRMIQTNEEWRKQKAEELNKHAEYLIKALGFALEDKIKEGKLDLNPNTVPAYVNSIKTLTSLVAQLRGIDIATEISQAKIEEIMADFIEILEQHPKIGETFKDEKPVILQALMNRINESDYEAVAK